MTSRKVDLEKLRVALRRLKRKDLLTVAERAIEIVPRTKLEVLVGDMVDRKSTRLNSSHYS